MRHLFLGVKQAEHENAHSAPSSAEVKNEWSFTSIALPVFMESCLIIYRSFNFLPSPGVHCPTHLKKNEKMYPKSVCFSPLRHKPRYWQKYSIADSTPTVIDFIFYFVTYSTY
jgi:hypothetical protein